MKSLFGKSLLYSQITSKIPNAIPRTTSFRFSPDKGRQFNTETVLPSDTFAASLIAHTIPFVKKEYLNWESPTRKFRASVGLNVISPLLLSARLHFDFHCIRVCCAIFILSCFEAIRTIPLPAKSKDTSSSNSFHMSTASMLAKSLIISMSVEFNFFPTTAISNQAFAFGKLPRSQATLIPNPMPLQISCFETLLTSSFNVLTELFKRSVAAVIAQSNPVIISVQPPSLTAPTFLSSSAFIVTTPSL